MSPIFRRVLQRSISAVPWRVRSTIKKIPFVAPLQRWLLERLLEGREFVHMVDAGSARGLNFPVTLPEDKGVWTGTYELEFSTALAEAVQPGDVCLDIGGWRGYYAGVMALAGAKKVLVFEPLPANCRQIQKLIDLNARLPISLLEMAAGEKSGTAEFCVMPMTSMGKLTASPFQQNATSDSRIAVNVVSLDELVQQGKIEPPDIIKIDVEGAEAIVLQGAQRVMAEHQPKFFLEAHSKSLARECSGILTRHGYDIHTVETGKNPVCATEPEICHLVAVPKINRQHEIQSPLRRSDALDETRHSGFTSFSTE